MTDEQITRPGQAPAPCPNCAYDLRQSFTADESKAVCPECGETWTREQIEACLSGGNVDRKVILLCIAAWLIIMIFWLLLSETPTLFG